MSANKRRMEVGCLYKGFYVEFQMRVGGGEGIKKHVSQLIPTGSASCSHSCFIRSTYLSHF